MRGANDGSAIPVSLQLTHVCKFALCTFCWFMAFQTVAGAWVPERQQGYSKSAVQYFKSNDFLGQADLNEFVGINVSQYGELGIGNHWAIIGQALYQDLRQTNLANETTRSSGLGDVEIGAKYQWQAEPFVLSTSLIVKLPYFYNEHAALPRGNGQEDVEARILLGKSLWPHRGYVGVEVGYRYRTQAPSDEIRYLVEYGYALNDNAYVRTKLDGIAKVGSADTFLQNGRNLQLGPEFDLAKLELTYGWNLGQSRPREQGRLGLELTYVYDLYGSNTLQGQALQFGITWTF